MATCEARFGRRTRNRHPVSTSARWIVLRQEIAIVESAHAVAVAERMIELNVLLIFIRVSSPGADVVVEHSIVHRSGQHV